MCVGRGRIIYNNYNKSIYFCIDSKAAYMDNTGKA